jgi:hypothetical protein
MLLSVYTVAWGKKTSWVCPCISLTSFATKRSEVAQLDIFVLLCDPKVSIVELHCCTKITWDHVNAKMTWDATATLSYKKNIRCRDNFRSSIQDRPSSSSVIWHEQYLSSVSELKIVHLFNLLAAWLFCVCFAKCTIRYTLKWKKNCGLGILSTKVNTVYFTVYKIVYSLQPQWRLPCQCGLCWWWFLVCLLRWHGFPWDLWVQSYWKLYYRGLIGYPYINILQQIFPLLFPAAGPLSCCPTSWLVGLAAGSQWLIPVPEVFSDIQVLVCALQLIHKSRQLSWCINNMGKLRYILETSQWDGTSIPEVSSIPMDQKNYILNYLNSHSKIKVTIVTNMAKTSFRMLIAENPMHLWFK